MTPTEFWAWAKRMLRQMKETEDTYRALRGADKRIVAAERAMRIAGATEAKIEKDAADEEESEWTVIQIEASQGTEGGNAAGVIGLAAPVTCTPADPPMPLNKRPFPEEHLPVLLGSTRARAAHHSTGGFQWRGFQKKGPFSWGGGEGSHPERGCRDLPQPQRQRERGYPQP